MPLSTRIGPYRVLRLINRGGQGGVYLGYDNRLQRRVAIKVHRLPAQRAGRKRLLREAQLVASIQSSKVAQIYDLHVAQDHVALIMEYVPGCDLEELLTRARPSLASVIAIATDLAGALTAARHQHIVHGDLKARNVLITDEGRIKLTDFGIARAEGDQTPGSVSAGSPSCISPEQYLGAELDHRSDLFALGCLLYRLLTGSHPFLVDARLDPNLLLMHSPVPIGELTEDLPPGLAQLVEKLLQKKPLDRPRDTQQVRAALRSISRTLPLSVSSTLLLEARPFFRLESPEELPPDIPDDLRLGGSSRLRPFQADEFSSWRDFFARVGVLRLSAGVLATAVLLGTLLTWLQPEAVRIQIDRPEIRLAVGTVLPPLVSPLWLVEQIKAAAAVNLGSIVVTGPVGATVTHTLYASPGQPEVEETLSVALRCEGEFCLFTLNRRGGGSAQLVLFPDMSLAEWRRAIRSATQSLFK